MRCSQESLGTPLAYGNTRQVLSRANACLCLRIDLQLTICPGQVAIQRAVGYDKCAVLEGNERYACELDKVGAVAICLRVHSSQQEIIMELGMK